MMGESSMQDELINRLPVYNLKFRYKCKRMLIGNYLFERATDYEIQQNKLQHTVNCTSEFSNVIQDGSHALTSYVNLPEKEEPANLAWSGPNTSALNDITLLLSLFTSRDVFIDKCTDDTTRTLAISEKDHRIFPFGGILVCSLEHKELNKTGRNYQDITITSGLNKVYEKVKQEDWQHQYNKGYFLILFKSAVQQRFVDSAFMQCWTIWEHLFACLNEGWMTEKSIRTINSREKISFHLTNFGLSESLSERQKHRINDLVNIRNRLIHFGKFPDSDNALADTILFVRLTECIVAKTLGLEPSNVLSTSKKLEAFLENEPLREAY